MNYDYDVCGNLNYCLDDIIWLIFISYYVVCRILIDVDIDIATINK